MASIIRIKRSSTAGDPSTLGTGELAYSALSGTQSNGGDRLYIGIGAETSGNAANHFVIGGKYFTDMMDHARGTLTANSAILVDADKKINELNVDNLTLDGNTISSTNTNGNITLDPTGTGYVEIAGTNALVIPVGTTAQRGPATNGAIRYNTDNSSFEGFSGANWSSLGGVKSVDGLTYISAELSPANSDDTLRFFTDGTLAVQIDADSAQFENKLVNVNLAATTASSSTTTGALTVAGGVGISGNLNVGGSLDVTGGVTYTGGATFNSNLTLVGSDTAGSEYFKVQNESLVDKFVVDSANGNTSISGTLDVNGQSTLASLNVEDLTATRLVYVGADGELVDSANLVYSAGQLGLTGTLAVSSNTTIGGTLGVSGATTLSSTLGVSGNTTIGGTLGVTGATTLSNTLGVSGNTTIGGTLGVTGNTILTADLAVNGGDLTTTATTFNLLNDTATTVNAFGEGTIITIGANGSGTTTIRNTTVAISNNATIGGTLSVTGTSSHTGNATFAGTVGVTGATTLSSTLGVTGETTLSNTLGVTGATTLLSTLQVNGATTIGQSGTRVATTVYGSAVSITGSDNTEIGVTAGAAGAKTLTITASNSVGSANLDINVDSTATLDANSISLDAADSSNFSIAANSASTKTLTIDAVNNGTGAAVVAIGSNDTDYVNIAANDATGTVSVVADTFSVDVSTYDFSATNVSLTGSSSVAITSNATTINSDTLTIRGTEGSGDTSNVAIAGRLDIDNIRMDGNTISTTDGSNTLYLDPAPAGSAGLVVIEGNLQVNGTTTTINSTQVTIDDPIFVLGGDSTPESDDNLDRGIEFQWHNGTDAKLGFFGYDDSASEFVFVPDATDTAGVITGTLGNAALAKLRLTDTTASTTTNTGALTVAGGVGITGQLNVAGNTNKFTSTQGSLSTTTGAVVIAGGLGLAQNLYMGGDLIGSGASTSTLSGFDIDGGTY